VVVALESARNFAPYGLLGNQVRYPSRDVRDTLPFGTAPKRLTVLRMDRDMYSSTIQHWMRFYNKGRNRVVM